MKKVIPTASSPQGKAVLKVLALFCLIGLPAALLSADTLAPCGSVAGNLVANCGFETGDFSGWTTGGNFEDTEVVSGAFYDYSGPNSGTYYAVMGPVGSDGTLSQTLSTTNGEKYTVSFYFASVGDSPSDFSALWDGSPLPGLPLTNPDTGSAYTQELFSVTGTGSDTLQFDFRDDPAYMALDDVVVVASTSPVPEPGTVGMLIAGLGAVILARRRVV